MIVSRFCKAGVAQPVEQLICNQRVGGSTPSASSTGSVMTGRPSYPLRGRSIKRPCPAEQGEVPEWLKGADCKSAASWLRRFESSPLHQGLPGGVSGEAIMAGIAQLARASAFQAEGRGFESRFPLQFARVGQSVVSPRGSVVEHFLGKEGVTGSIPVVGSSETLGSTPGA